MMQAIEQPQIVRTRFLSTPTKLTASDYFLLLAIVAFFFEGSLRKWVLDSEVYFRMCVCFRKSYLFFWELHYRKTSVDLRVWKSSFDS